uniref:Ribonuclease H-like domain-containing protein n=1 Tax=Tanacetum cinerariifolium TaxID=118510 RepID=A0A6L2M8P7_TANCI|nr:ribonuclease H-like domain-containing protein [Tanacetum cinerariifolium]
MRDSWGSLLIKVPRSANRLYKAQLNVGKEGTNEVGRESKKKVNPHSSSVTIRETNTHSEEDKSRSDGMSIRITRLEAIRLLIALATRKGWKIYHLDVKIAFINGNRKKLDATLKEMGFLQCVHEKTIYRKVSNEEFIIVVVYEDDLCVTEASLYLINEFKRRMASQFEMKDLGELTYYLGIQVSQGKDCVEIKQERYAMKILKEAGMEDCNPALCPMEPGLKLSKEEDEPEILRYLKCTTSFGIKYKRGDDMRLVGYSSHNVDIDDGQSTTEHVLYFGTSPITWCSQKSKLPWHYLRVKMSSWQPLQMRIRRESKSIPVNEGLGAHTVQGDEIVTWCARVTLFDSEIQEIDSIVNILTSLDARDNDEDVVHYALEGLPDTYNQVCGYMHWKDTFPDLKTVRSLLIIKEMHLKSKALALPVDSSSPMGTYRFGASCRYVHDANARVGTSNSGTNKGSGSSDNSTNELLNKLLQQLGSLGVNAIVSSQSPNTTHHVAFHASPVTTLSSPLGPTHRSGFPTPTQSYYYTIGPTPATSHLAQPIPTQHQTSRHVRCFFDVIARGTSILLRLLLPFHMSFLSLNMRGISDLDIQKVKVLWRLIFNNVISSNKEKPLVLFHAYQLGKHVRLSFVSSSTIVTSCLDIVHSDTLIPRPPDANVVHCIWLFHHKYLADGTLSRYKAQLVANGSTQLEGVDVDETFSPVVKPRTIQTILSLAASRHWSIHQLDVKNAFLHGDFRCDTSLSIYRQGMDTAYLLLYVDDIVLTASSQALLQRIIYSLHQEFAMTNLGSLNYFLGIFVTSDSSGMFLSQKKYVVEILVRAGMVNCNPNRTPVDTKSKLGDTSDVISDPTLYRSLAGSLRYLIITRPDISYAVQKVCLHMHDPREPHLSALKRILRYVCGTLDYGLQLFSSFTTDLVAYSDADWVGCPTTRAEAEYRGVANAVVETCWLRNLLHELHTLLSFITLIYCDNYSAVYLSCNPVQHQRRKHIEIDIYFVHDLVATGQVRVLHVPSRYQFADIFTKGLPSALFEEFRSSLSVRRTPAQTAREC